MALSCKRVCPTRKLIKTKIKKTRTTIKWNKWSRIKIHRSLKKTFIITCTAKYLSIYLSNHVFEIKKREPLDPTCRYGQTEQDHFTSIYFFIWEKANLTVEGQKTENQSKKTSGKQVQDVRNQTLRGKHGGKTHTCTQSKDKGLNTRGRAG